MTTAQAGVLACMLPMVIRPASLPHPPTSSCTHPSPAPSTLHFPCHECPRRRIPFFLPLTPFSPSPPPPANAPVTKGILLASAGASIFSQAARASSRHPVPLSLQPLSHILVFRSPAELVFGTFLIYYFRLLERQNGSAKFGSFALLSTGVSLALQLAFTALLRRQAGPPGWTVELASGPYGLIFACFVQFFCQVPACSKFSVLGCRLSDKVRDGQVGEGAGHGRGP